MKTVTRAATPARTPAGTAAGTPAGTTAGTAAGTMLHLPPVNNDKNCTTQTTHYTQHTRKRILSIINCISTQPNITYSTIKQSYITKHSFLHSHIHTFTHSHPIVHSFKHSKQHTIQKAHDIKTQPKQHTTLTAHDTNNKNIKMKQNTNLA